MSLLNSSVAASHSVPFKAPTFTGLLLLGFCVGLDGMTDTEASDWKLGLRLLSEPRRKDPPPSFTNYSHPKSVPGTRSESRAKGKKTATTVLWCPPPKVTELEDAVGLVYRSH